MNLALAPMDWITDSAYRRICQKVFEQQTQKTDEFFLFTEFMNASGYIRNPEWVYKHILNTTQEKNLTAQIYWWDEYELLETFEDIDKNYNFSWLELNIWCPSPKVVSSGGWAWMLYEKEKTLKLIQKISRKINSPFSIKTRIWVDKYDINSQKKFIIEASNFCNLITVHWRTFKQAHSGDVDRETIYEIRQNSNFWCKIFGNWWIDSYAKAKEKIGNLDGIMIWQASIWNPWIFTNTTPNYNEILETILEHLDEMCSLESIFEKYKWNKYLPTIKEQGIQKEKQNLLKKDNNKLKSPIEFRKHLFAYLKWLPNSKDFKQKIVNIKTHHQLRNEISKFIKK